MKKLLISTVIGLALVFGISWLLSTTLPSYIQRASTQALTQYFNKDVILGETSFNLIRGISYRDITLYDKGTQTVYARMRGVNILPFYPSLLGTKKIIFWVKIDEAYLRLTRDTSGAFDIPTIKNKGTLSDSYIINAFAIKKLTLDFQDKITNISRRFSDIRISANLLTPPHARFSISWSDKAHFRGKYNLKEGNIKANLLAHNIELAALHPYITNFQLSNAHLKEANLTIVGKGTYLVSGEGVLTDIKLFFPFMNTASNTEQIIRANGDIRVTGGAVASNGREIFYRVTGALEKMHVDGLPIVGDLKDTQADFTLDTTSLDIRAIKTVIKGIPIQAHVNIKDFKAPKIYAQGSAQAPLENVATAMAQIVNIELLQPISGDSQIDFVVRGNTLEKSFDYLLEYQLTNAAIGELKDVFGRGRIQRDTLFLDDARLSYRNLPLTIKGVLESISSFAGHTNGETPARLTLKGNTDTTLAKLSRATAGLGNFSFTYTGPGEIGLTFTLSGDPVRKEFQYSGDYSVNGVRIGNLEHIKARGKLGSDTLTIKEGSFSWHDIPFIIRGTMEHFAQPRFNAAIESNGFSAIGKGHRAANTLEIERVIIKGKDTDITAQGTLGFTTSETTITGKGNLGIEEALTWAGKIGLHHAALKPGALGGTLATTFIASGTGSPNQWRVTAQAQAPGINIYRARVHDVRAVLLKDRNTLTVSPLTGQFAQGIIELRAKIDFPQQKLTANVLANDINLTTLKDELSLKAKNLSGKLSLEASVENTSLGREGALTGQGKITVKEGNIWEINFLKGMGEFLFIPDFDEIKFKEGYSDFSLKNNNIIFENIELKSFQMNMEGGGIISQGSGIHFMLFPRFNQDLVAASEGLKKITTNFLGKSGLLIEIQGTLKEPQYKVQPLLLSPMQRIKKFFKELQN